MKTISHIKIYKELELTCLHQFMADVGNRDLRYRDILVNPPVVPAESNEWVRCLGGNYQWRSDRRRAERWICLIKVSRQPVKLLPRRLV